MPNIVYVDLDGVLANLTAHYAESFGVVPTHEMAEDEFWQPIFETQPDIFARLPLMPDAHEGWRGLCALLTNATRHYLHPVILTAAPKRLPRSVHDKRVWVSRHFGAHVEVIATTSPKHLYATSRDILIDDWPKRHRKRWEKAGGVFVAHESWARTLTSVEEHIVG